MTQYIIRRLLLTLVLAFGVATIVFGLIQLAPGDVAQALASEEATAEEIEAIRERLGINKPIHIQYITWIGKLFKGDMGNSLVTARPVAKDLVARFPRTMELVIAALVFGFVTGIPLGIICALHQNRWPDYLITVVSLLKVSAPVFVVATALVLIFSYQLRWIPSAGYIPPTRDPMGHLRFLIMPMLSIGLSSMATVIRFTRSSMLEVMRQDYVRTARAKGLHEFRVVYVHALKNALIPVVTVVGVAAGGLLGGTVIIEAIFTWPGMSTYLIDGVNRRDFTAVQGATLMIAAVFIFVNLLVDIINAYLDPRIHYG